MRRSRGSAPLEFVLAVAPLLLVTVSTMGIVANGFAKNVAQDSAIEAARFGAFADQTAQTAQARAEVALRSRLGAIFQARVLVSKVERGSDCYVKGSVELTYLAVGFLPQPIRVREEALAACELE